MVGQEDVDNVIAVGAKGRVLFATRRNGTMEAKDWLDTQNDGVRAGFGVLFMRLAAFGFIDNQQLFSKMKGMDDVWEFRKGPNRLFCVRYGNVWLVTHHYPKGHSKKHQTAAGNHALSIANEHIKWHSSNEQKGSDQ